MSKLLMHITRWNVARDLAINSDQKKENDRWAGKMIFFPLSWTNRDGGASKGFPQGFLLVFLGSAEFPKGFRGFPHILCGFPWFLHGFRMVWKVSQVSCSFQCLMLAFSINLQLKGFTRYKRLTPLKLVLECVIKGLNGMGSLWVSKDFNLICSDRSFFSKNWSSSFRFSHRLFFFSFSRSRERTRRLFGTLTLILGAKEKDSTP